MLLLEIPRSQAKVDKEKRNKKTRRLTKKDDINCLLSLRNNIKNFKNALLKMNLEKPFY